MDDSSDDSPIRLPLSEAQQDVISARSGVTLREITLSRSGFVALALATSVLEAGRASASNSHHVLLELTVDQTAVLSERIGRTVSRLSIDVNGLRPNFRSAWNVSGEVSLTAGVRTEIGTNGPSDGHGVIWLPPEGVATEAFGDGTHATTSLAARLLEGCEVSGRAVADVGSGTGVLTVLASQLGARSVDAFDIDPAAVAATRLVVEANATTAEVRVLERSVQASDGPYDFIVANIITGVLIELAETLASAASQRGSLILSGIIKGRMLDLEAVFAASGYRLAETVTTKSWVAGLFRPG